MIILGIETSCDETAAALVEDGRKVLSNVVASQIEEHKIYGGVVPEIASRRHSEAISAVVEEALTQGGVSLAQVSAIAVTCAPGLIGALLVGINFAKGLALSTGLPLMPVHHLRGHIAANYLCHPELEPPFLCLVVSGGHSHIVMVHSYTQLEVLARTRDDAAGEAFDKAARAMGIPYPGGVELDRVAESIHKVEAMGQELRNAGGHLKNAGRAAAGKEARQIDGGQEGKFQAAVLAPLRAVHSMLGGLNRTAYAALGAVDRLSRTAERGRGKREKSSVRQRLEGKPPALPAPVPAKKSHEAER